MLKPKRYRAMTVDAEYPDPFTGKRSRPVEGYYVRHITQQHNGWGATETLEEFNDKHSVHYIAENGWADWGMPTDMRMWEIKIETLEELPDDSSRSD